MNNLKSFFKKHYKRFVTISVTACLCFCFLFCSVSADEYEFTIYDCQMIDFSSSEDGLIEEPFKYDDSLWAIHKYLQLYQYQKVVMNFTCSDYMQCFSSAYEISIPFAFLPESNSISTSNLVTSCFVEFVSNGVRSITQVDLNYGNQYGRNCFFADATFDIVIPNDVSVLFDTFTLTFYSFDGYFTGDLHGFGFYKNISAIGIGSASFPSSNIDNATNVENDILNDVTDAGSESINTVFSNPTSSLPSGVFYSLNCIRAIWGNFLSRTNFSYIFNFSLALGMFAFVVGMGSILVGSVRRSVNRNQNNRNRGGK